MVVARPKRPLEVGGLVDESRATLAIYGDDLDPNKVSEMLGCAPSHAHRKGDRLSATAVPFKSGAWLLTVETKAPKGPDAAIAALLARFPEAPEFWSPVVEKFSVRSGNTRHLIQEPPQVIRHSPWMRLIL